MRMRGCTPLIIDHERRVREQFAAGPRTISAYEDGEISVTVQRWLMTATDPYLPGEAMFNVFSLPSCLFTLAYRSFFGLHCEVIFSCVLQDAAID